MGANGLIDAARATAGVLVLVSVLGMLFFAHLPVWSLAYGLLTIAACGAFCLFPRRWLRRASRVMVGLSLATLGATLFAAYEDVTLVGGPDYPAIVIRAVEVWVLIVMLKEALKARAAPAGPGLWSRRRP